MQRTLLSLLSLALASTALRASPIVDQLNNPNTNSSGIAVSAFSPGSNGATGQAAAQVFTAGITGQLTQVDLGIWNYSNQSGTYRVQIWGTSYPATVAAWTSFDLTGSNLFVTAGQQYAIVLTANAAFNGGYIEGGWGGIFNNNSYAGGDGYYRGANATNTPNYTTWQAGFPVSLLKWTWSSAPLSIPRLRQFRSQAPFRSWPSQFFWLAGVAYGVDRSARALGMRPLLHSPQQYAWLLNRTIFCQPGYSLPMW